MLGSCSDIRSVVLWQAVFQNPSWMKKVGCEDPAQLKNDAGQRDRLQWSSVPSMPMQLAHAVKTRSHVP